MSIICAMYSPDICSITTLAGRTVLSDSSPRLKLTLVRPNR